MKRNGKKLPRPLRERPARRDRHLPGGPAMNGIDVELQPGSEGEEGSKV